jgi:hypothetical protein
MGISQHININLAVAVELGGLHVVYSPIFLVRPTENGVGMAFKSSDNDRCCG